MRWSLRWLPAFVVLPIALVTCAGHLRTLGFAFWMDAFDVLRVHADPTAVFSVGMAWGESRYVRPLWLAILVVEKRLFGAEPFGYHLVSLALHGITAATLYVATRRLGAPAPLAWSTTAVWLTFGWNAYTVAWAGPMVPELIAAPAAMIALVLFNDGGEPDHRRRALLAALAFALSILAKETTLPFALLLTLLAWTGGHLTFRQALLRTAPFWTVVASYTVLRLAIFGRGAVPVRLGGATVDWLPLTPERGLAVVTIFAGNIVRQLGFIVLPVPMVPLDALGATFVVATFVVFAGLGWLVMRPARWPAPDRRLAQVGALWCAVLVLPCMFASHPRLLYQVAMGFAMVLAAALHTAATWGARAVVPITAVAAVALYLTAHAAIGWRIDDQFAGASRATLSIYADDYTKTARTAPRDAFDRALREHVRAHLAKHGCLDGTEVAAACRTIPSYDLNGLLSRYRFGTAVRDLLLREPDPR